MFEIVEFYSAGLSREPCLERPGKHQLASGLAIMKINEGFNLKSLLKICSFLHSNSETHLQLIRTVPSVIPQHTASVNTDHLSFITIKKSNKQWTRKQQFGHGSLQHNAVNIPCSGRKRGHRGAKLMPSASILTNDGSGTGDYFLLLKLSGERRWVVFFFNENKKEVLSEPHCKQREKVIICFGLLSASPVPHRIYCLQFK